jgi:hypothetical protein
MTSKPTSRAIESWRELAPEGYRLLDVPQLIVPAHQVVIELDDDVFVAGDPDGPSLYGYGLTPVGAFAAYEQLLHRCHLDCAGLYTGRQGTSDTTSPALSSVPRPNNTFTPRGRRWHGSKKVSA